MSLLSRQDAERGELLYQRGLCHLRTGARQAARVDFEDCLAVEDSPLAEEARRELRALDGSEALATDVASHAGVRA